MTIDLRGCDLAQMQAIVQELGQPKFRAKQLFDWVHQKCVTAPEQMSNLGTAFLTKLDAGGYTLSGMTLSQRQIAQDGTEKFLFQLADGHYVECVLMRYRGDQSKQRNTLCVSSQVGCAMGCSFCATGQSGFARNLTVGEILGQIYDVDHLLLAEKEPLKIGNVVFMGMGEPLLNLDNVLTSIDLLNDEAGQNISRRRITVSTCGIVPQIKQLAERGRDIVLAISLHAPNDDLRSGMMPINRQYPLAELLEACHFYQQETGKRLSFEYALIKDVNDQPIHVQQLAKLLRGLDCHLNVIPVNPVADAETFQKPQKARIRTFLAELKQAGLNASIREEKGTDIDGACGQLRGKMLGEISE